MTSPIAPITPIYKTDLRKQPYQNIYLPDRKPKEVSKEVLNKEIMKEIGYKISVRI